MATVQSITHNSLLSISSRSMDKVEEEVLNYDLIEDLLTLLLVENNKKNTCILDDSIINYNAMEIVYVS